MKKMLIILCFLLAKIGLSQTLLLEDNFNYSTGTLSTVSADWSESPIGSVDIQVVTGSLSFTGYPSSGVGNKIALDGGASGRSGVVRQFTNQSSSGTTVYFSFLLNVTSTTDMDINSSDGDYFYNFQNSSSSTFRAYIYVRQGSNSTKFNIGLAKSSATSLTWYSTELDVGVTYLVVAAYTFITGSGNDEVKLWVNPNLSGAEPSPDVSIGSGTDASDLEFIQFRQRDLSGDMEIDGLRLATDWSLAPLPVELSSFSAIILDRGVKLNWRTETEVNNYGFEILRRIYPAKGGTQNDNWLYIGFVNGNGNSNSPKDYSFIDENISAGKYSYRLKQIDTDGQFEYSKIISVEIGSQVKLELSQNYPNPFNPSTTISFSLPKPSNAKITIYNTIGQQVAEIINSFKDAGVHTINFDGSGLNSGFYIYKLEANGLVQTKKMMLLK